MDATQIAIWQTILASIGTLAIIVGGAFGGFRYFQEQEHNRQVRREELAWRKSQFILELCDQFSKNEEYTRAWCLTEFDNEIPKGSTLSRILGADARSLNSEEIESRMAVDHFMDFFDRLYHFTFVTKALNPIDLELFAWYIRLIADHKDLREYALRGGYADVLTLQQEMEKLRRARSNS